MKHIVQKYAELNKEHMHLRYKLSEEQDKAWSVQQRTLKTFRIFGFEIVIRRERRRYERY